MDWTEVFRICSIVGGGFSGVLGLLTDFREKSSGEMTIAGKAALVGIGVSTLTGIFIHLAETGREASKSEAAAKTTTEMVQALRALTLPLASSTLRATFKARCLSKTITLCDHSFASSDEFISLAKNSRIAVAIRGMDATRWDGQLGQYVHRSEAERADINGGLLRGQAVTERMSSHDLNFGNTCLVVDYKTTFVPSSGVDDLLDLVGRNVIVRIDPRLGNKLATLSIMTTNGTAIILGSSYDIAPLPGDRSGRLALKFPDEAQLIHEPTFEEVQRWHGPCSRQG